IEDTLQVDRDHEIKIRFRHLPDKLTFLELDQLAITQYACIVHEHIDAAILGNHIIDPLLNVFAAGHVDLVKCRAFTKQSSGLLTDGFVHITNDDLRTFFSEAQGGCLSNSCRAASYKYNFILHSHGVSPGYCAGRPISWFRGRVAQPYSIFVSEGGQWVGCWQGCPARPSHNV